MMTIEQIVDKLNAIPEQYLVKSEELEQLLNDLKICSQCKKAYPNSQFYDIRHTNPKKKLSICKECATQHIDVHNPDTFLWILQDIDAPYIPSQWNKYVNAYPDKTPKLIMGKYVSLMKLKGYSFYTWKDTLTLMENYNYGKKERLSEVNKNAN